MATIDLIFDATTPATPLDLEADAGANYAADFVLLHTNGVAYDLTNHAAAMKVRPTFGATDVLSLTNASGITLGTTNGTISLAAGAATVAAIAGGTAVNADKAGNAYVYDLRITTPAGAIKRLAQGRFTVFASVT